MCDRSGQAEKTVAACGEYCTLGTAFVGAANDPVTYLIIQPFGLFIQVVLDISECLQLIHDLQCLHAAPDAENAFQSDNTA